MQELTNNTDNTEKIGGWIVHTDKVSGDYKPTRKMIFKRQFSQENRLSLMIRGTKGKSDYRIELAIETKEEDRYGVLGILRLKDHISKKEAVNKVIDIINTI